MIGGNILEKNIMDPRLQEASFAGDVQSLRHLLREDRLLLNRPTYCSDTPLHVAAALGHADFAAELLRVRPDLAFELGAGGHTPLHPAAANGHVAVVKALLLLSPRSNICLLRDKDGLTPVHSAALKGRTDVLRELVGACPVESVRAAAAAAAAGRGETVLHLAVRSGSFEAVEFLVERAGDQDLFNSKDHKGNTALHLAVARKQLQTMKLMLSKPSVDVNSANLKGLTPLDVLLESPDEQYGDMALAEMILAAGGKTATELQLPPAAVLLPRQAIRQKRVKHGEEYRTTPGTLMVVATLIATITFQAALNPPGGFIQKELDKTDDDQPAGKVVLGEKLNLFLIFDVIGLFASVSIILLFICVTPRRKRMMGVLSWIMWAAVLSTALALQELSCRLLPGLRLVRYLECRYGVDLFQVRDSSSEKGGVVEGETSQTRRERRPSCDQEDRGGRGGAGTCRSYYTSLLLVCYYHVRGA